MIRRTSESVWRSHTLGQYSIEKFRHIVFSQLCIVNVLAAGLWSETNVAFYPQIFFTTLNNTETQSNYGSGLHVFGPHLLLIFSLHLLILKI